MRFAVAKEAIKAEKIQKLAAKQAKQKLAAASASAPKAKAVKEEQTLPPYVEQTPPGEKKSTLITSSVCAAC